MTQRLRLILISLLCTGLLLGCASQNLQTYAGQKPDLNLPQYFNGTVDGYGIFTDRSGTVRKRFTVRIACDWQGDQGTLDEDFTYADGSTQKRIWHLTRGADGHFTGRADDVLGEAIGESLGNTLHWTYTLLLPVDGRTVEVQFDDWMYRMSDQVLLNKATMRKFGVTLGEVTLSFFKR